ncbi:hypothetical protein D3C87_1773130 [compost metagenome]
MVIAPAACRRATATIEEGHFNTKLTRNLRQFLLSTVDRPVGAQIPAIFGSVRKSNHNGLVVFTIVQMVTVKFIFVKRPHNVRRIRKIVDGLKQWNDIQCEVSIFIRDQVFRQRYHLHHI